MVNFLSSFLPNLRRLLIPIYDLQKKAKKFKWAEEAKKAFNEIKKLLINPLILKAPTPDGLFLLESDTSREGMGGTLLQKQRDEWGSHWISFQKTPKIGKEYRHNRVRINRIISEHSRFYAIAIQQILKF